RLLRTTAEPLLVARLTLEHLITISIPGKPMRIPMSSPDLTPAETAAVTEVMTSSHLSIGPKICEFEAAIARFVGTEYAVGVNSGTSGLHMTMIAAGVGRGDFVI